MSTRVVFICLVVLGVGASSTSPRAGRSTSDSPIPGALLVHAGSAVHYARVADAGMNSIPRVEGFISLFSTTDVITGMDYNFERSWLFLATDDNGTMGIERLQMNVSVDAQQDLTLVAIDGPVTIHTADVGVSLAHVTVDWVYNELYYVESEASQHRIRRMVLDDTGDVIAIYCAIEMSRSTPITNIIVDPTRGFFYWSTGTNLFRTVLSPLRLNNTNCPASLGPDVEMLASTTALNAFTIEQSDLYFYGRFDCSGQDIFAVQTLMLSDVENPLYTLTIPDEIAIRQMDSFTDTIIYFSDDSVLFSVAINPNFCPNFFLSISIFSAPGTVGFIRMYRESKQPLPTPPGPPSGVHISTTDTTATLEWAAPLLQSDFSTDAFDDWTYVIELCRRDTLECILNSTSALTFTFPGLVPNTSYTASITVAGPGGNQTIPQELVFTTNFSVTCNTTGAVRLVNGCDSLEGRVEVCYDGLWGTVCSDRWSNVDAGVVCTQLGFPGPGARFVSGAFFGEGMGPIWLDEVNCVGDEQQILNCPLGISEIGGGDCRHFEDAGVRCPSACICGELRLSGSDSYYEGRVEVCSEGVLETVIPCDENWQDIHAQVVCQQLGFFNPGHIVLGNSSFTSGITGRYLEDLSCNGDEATFGDCSYTAVDMQNCSSLDNIAAVRCAVTNVTFIPFGAAAGDNEVTLVRSEVMSLGPFDLETPLVFYLQQEYQLYITSNGVFSFEEVNVTQLQFLQSESSNTLTPSQSSTTPLIATLWTLTPSEQDNNRTLYARVAQDNTTLGLVRDMIAAENTALSDYQPTVAIVVTWTRELMEVGQVILSSDGRASFATFVLNDGEGLRALETSNLLYFGAGDGLRSHRLPRPASLMALQNSPRSFRIDGDHVAAAESACALSAFTIGFERFIQLQARFFSCSCYLDLVPSQMDSGESDMGSGQGIPFPMCVPGSVPIRSNGQLLSCHPVYLPCLIMDSCPANSSSLNCSTETSDFIPFGRGVGDTLGPHEHDAVAGPLNLNVPVMYFGRQHIRLYVTTNGYVSFDGPFDMPNACSFLPCADVPVIAPIWIDLDFLNFGLLYYRVSQDSATLERVRDMIVQQNPATLSAYQPTLAVIVTWSEARPDFSMVDDTFQLIVSTDGEVSFSTWIFNDTEVLPPFIDSTDFVRIGFDGSRTTTHFIDVGQFLMATNMQLPPVSFYRIDGPCITTASPANVCILDAVATECANLTATVCTCDPGFRIQGSSCVDIDECLQVDICDENAICQNTEGSFMCSCRAGFFENGDMCSDTDECLGDRNPCGSNSECFNTLGSFGCTCEPGFIMTQDNSTCEAEPTSVPLSTVLPSVLVPSTLLILFVLAIITVVVIQIRKRHNRVVKGLLDINLTQLQDGEQGSSNQYSNNLRLNVVRSSFKLQVSKSLLINACNLQIGTTIGQGEFGIVYKAKLRPAFNKQFCETVAVKTLKGFVYKDKVTDLLKECAKMKEFDHPNVLTLRGVCLDGGPAPYIIMPFITNGSLLARLKNSRETLVVDPESGNPDDVGDIRKQLLDMCIQVAKGMEYLASKKVIHRDLAARNCMIDSGLVIKVADFGLSEGLDNKEYFRQTKEEVVKLPLKWLALESINDGLFSEKSDVWAYGVTCWEIFSGGKSPYTGIHPLEIATHLEQGYRMEKPPNAACLDEMYAVVMSCWESKPEDRPNFSQLVNRFVHFLGSLAEYFDLVLGNLSADANLNPDSVFSPHTADSNINQMLQSPPNEFDFDPDSYTRAEF